MYRNALWMGIAPVAMALSACTPSGQTDTLEQRTSDPNATASGTDDNTFNHNREATGTQNGITDIPAKQADESQAGTPIEVAKMHGAQKISYASLGALLSDFGVSLDVTQTTGKGNGAPDGKGNPLDPGEGQGANAPTLATAGDLYANGRSALGAAVYASRTPEMIVPSTSSLAKEFDIFVAAAPEIIANIGSSKRCPGVVLVQSGQLTADGISCLIGKPATPDHLTLASKLVSDIGDAQKGPAIAVATILASAHISE